MSDLNTIYGTGNPRVETTISDTATPQAIPVPADELREAVANVMKHAPETSCGDGPYNSAKCSNEVCDSDDLCHAIYKLKAATKEIQ